MKKHLPAILQALGIAGLIILALNLVDDQEDQPTKIVYMQCPIANGCTDL